MNFFPDGGGSDTVLRFSLTAASRPSYAFRASRPDGRRFVRSGGKSGLHTDAAPDNVRRGRPQGKRHRKQTAQTGRRSIGVRVKGCGKSAPRRRQRRRHGKPRREQDRIGATRGFSRGALIRWPCRSGWLLEVPGDGRPRGMAVTSEQNSGHTEPGLQAGWRSHRRSSMLGGGPRRKGRACCGRTRLSPRAPGRATRPTAWCSSSMSATAVALS